MDTQTLNAQFSASMDAAAARKTMPQQARSVEQARKVAQDFEAMFVSQMMQHMFSGLDETGGYFGGGHAEAMFRPMLVDEYSKMLTKRPGGIGLADQVMASLLQSQEQAQGLSQGLAPQGGRQ